VESPKALFASLPEKGEKGLGKKGRNKLKKKRKMREECFGVNFSS